MKKYFLIAVLACFATVAFAQPEGWSLFAKTKFETKYNEKAAEYFLIPVFPDELKSLVGKEVSLEGYYMPIDVEGNTYIILSKYPYSQCFFCGAAGPESIAEVTFKVKPSSKFESDQYLRVKGRVKLNDADLEHGNFLLVDAVLISK
jgi:hypothetical protein